MSSSLWVFIVLFTSAEVCGQADEFETVEVMEGDVLNLHPGVELKGDVQIMWSLKDTRVAQMYQGKIYTHYDEKFTDRIQLDPKTGVLSISNIRTSDSGLFSAFIVIDRQISNKMFNVNVYGTSQASMTTSAYQTSKAYSPGEDCEGHCGGTEALIRLILSALVGIAIVVFLVDHVTFCSSQKRDSSV